jgi:hypothetical protein
MNHYSRSVFLLILLSFGFLRKVQALDSLSALPSDETLSVRQLPHKSTFNARTKLYALGDYVSFPASGVKIQQPAGFEKDQSFDGFSNPESQSSIMAIRFQLPYAKINGAFTQEQLKTRGWTLRSRKDVKVDNLPGILIHFEQPLGDQAFLKWSLIFGNDQTTTMVTAAFPKKHEKQLSNLLKAVVLSSVQMNQSASFNAGTGLPFTLTASKKLKLTQSISRTLTYTKGGVFPGKSPMEPMFIVVPSIGKVLVANQPQYAEQLLQQMEDTKKLIVKSTKTIMIAGLHGYESLAEAEDEKLGTPFIIYQVILFNQDSYIRMLGLTKVELRDEYLPEFKAMARSLQRKQL